jgi:chaperonin cofactor prefoldin
MSQEQLLSVDPNVADIETLDQLPGVGPAMARRIAEARPFTGPEDMLRVSGISAAFLERLRPFLDWPDAPPSTTVEGRAAPVPGNADPELPGSDDGNAIEPETASEAEAALSGAHDDGEMLLARPVLEPEAPFVDVSSAGERAEPEVEDLLAEPEPDEVAAAEPYLEAPEAVLSTAEGSEVDVETLDVVLEAEVERAPEESEEAALPKVEETADQKAAAVPITRRYVFRAVAIGGLLFLLLSLLVNLGVLSALNSGQLSFVRPAQLNELAVRVDGLGSRAETLETDVSGLRTRLDNLEALSGRVQTLERASEQMQADLETTATELEGLAKEIDGVATRVGGLEEQTEELSAQVDALDGRADELETRAEALETRTEALEGQVGRFEDFLGGLRDLLDGVFGAEENTK